jgi:hypothetical protein
VIQGGLSFFTVIYLFEQITITENEVEDILKILDTSKAIGPDLLNPRLLKEAASMLRYPLCRLFNLSLTLSTFPSEAQKF